MKLYFFKRRIESFSLSQDSEDKAQILLMAFKARMTSPSHLLALFLPFFHSFHFRLYLCSASFCFLNLPCHSSDLPFAHVFLVLSFPGQLLFILQDSALISPPLWSPPWLLQDGPGRCTSGFSQLCVLALVEHFSDCVIIAHWLSYILYSYLLPFDSNFPPILQRKLKQICGAPTVLSKASDLPHLLASCFSPHLLALDPMLLPVSRACSVN